MGKTIKLLTGLGVLAGITYFGKRRHAAESLAFRGAGFFGYMRGLGKGFKYGVKSVLKLR